MPDYRTGTEASDAYGGYSGDRATATGHILAAKREALDGFDRAINPLGWAEAQFQYGSALGTDLQTHPIERFDGALRAFKAARDVWEAVGSAAQRARGWTATGNAWKNLVTGVRRQNLEEAIHDLNEALTCAREAQDDVLIANAHNGLATAYTYRLIGDKATNIYAAVEHQQTAIDLYQKIGNVDRVVISLVSVGIAWTKHPDLRVGLERAHQAYSTALHLLGSLEFPAPQKRRFGTSAGHTALQRSDWGGAVRAFQIAYDATETILAEATSQASRAVELAEHGSITARLASALILSGDPIGGAHLIESSRLRTVTIKDPDSGPVPDSDDPWAGLEAGEAICYVTSSVAGTVSVMISGDPSKDVQTLITPKPLLDEIQSAAGAPPLIPGHGRAVTAQMLPGEGLVREFPNDVVDMITAGIVRPLAVQLEGSNITSVTFVPVDAVADLPLHIGLLDRPPGSVQREVIRAGYAPSARLALHTRSRARNATRREPYLVGVRITDSSLGPLAAAESELDTVVRAFPGQSLVLDSNTATLDAVMDALPRASHIHLACHGRFLHTDPKSSYFELAGTDRLTLDTISRHKLFADARVVVATACDMGASDTLHWADASDGLPSRLLAEGVGSLIAPLHPVYDLAAALFSSRFYSHLFIDGREESPAAALALTQRWLRDLTRRGLVSWLIEHPELLPQHRRNLATQGADEPLWRDVPSFWGEFCHFGIA
jgi:CHAT domain-containing protein/tetratricopeptide (TPR) repeat protein